MSSKSKELDFFLQCSLQETVLKKKLWMKEILMVILLYMNTGECSGMLGGKKPKTSQIIWVA